ncbi:unnamed protein product [Scytosiphon promiscuus]
MQSEEKAAFMQVGGSPRSAYTVQISCYEAEIAGLQVLAQADDGAGLRIDALRAQIQVLEQKIAEIDESQRRSDAQLCRFTKTIVVVLVIYIVGLLTLTW